jgi:adenylate cyclase
MSAARGLNMQDGQRNKVLEFDGFVVDLDAALLKSAGRVIETEPQVFELIAFLCTNPGRLIGYDEIIAKVWHGRIVSDAAIATRINAARKALGDDGTAQRVIKTVRGRGLRFELEPVNRSIEAKTHASVPVCSNDLGRQSNLDGPSIAVLPFDNMSLDAEQEYFADGIVEDIITGLSRVAQFFVIARNSTFAYKGRSVDVRQVGRELGVRYVLEGSVRKAGNRVRITGQLVDASTGHHIWVDRFDGDLVDVFSLQDQITSRVIGAIQPPIRAAETRRSQRKRPDNLDAYDYYMQALPHVASLARKANTIGLGLLEKALLLEPDYAAALAMAAWCHAQRCVYGWTDEPEPEGRLALQLANKAVKLAANDSFALSMLGAANTLVREFDKAYELLQRALELDPNCAWGWNRLGWLNGYLDRPKESIECFEKAIRLSPLDPTNFNCFAGIGAARFLEGRHDGSVTWQEKALAANPEARWIYRQLIPAYVGAGRMEDARRGVRLLIEDYPSITCEKVRVALLYSAPTMDRICDGLARAGLPVRQCDVKPATTS